MVTTVRDSAIRKCRTRNEHIRRKFLIQRLIGVLMIVLAIVFAAMVLGTGEDGGAVILFVAFGVWLLCSRKVLLI